MCAFGYQYSAGTKSLSDQILGTSKNLGCSLDTPPDEESSWNSDFG